MSGGKGMALLAAALCCAGAVAHAAPIGIVAGETVYGDLAARVGGPHVAVTSILANPAADPHLFETSPSVARAVAGAGLVVQNGLGYDPWLGALLRGNARPGQQLVVVAELVHRHPGEDPHLWFDPAVAPAVVGALADSLSRRDPADAADYAARRDRTLAAIAPVAQRVKRLRGRFAGIPVTATEPVFSQMAAALGLLVRDRGFQLATMNDTEPAASDVAAIEDDLRQRRVRLLIVNAQVGNAATRRLRAIADKAGVPVVGISETQPRGLDYTGWMMAELDQVERALSGAVR